MHFVFRFTSCFGVRSQGFITDTIQITTEIYYLQEVNYGVVSFFFLQVSEIQSCNPQESTNVFKH
jgi:hypothetical protein